MFVRKKQNFNVGDIVQVNLYDFYGHEEHEYKVALVTEIFTNLLTKDYCYAKYLESGNICEFPRKINKCLDYQGRKTVFLL